MSPSSELAEALAELADILEARGEYTYDVVNEKRWVLGDGGQSGNCEICEENADVGWIGDDETFIDSEGGDIDGPPAHPNDTCDLEYRERRVRVYESRRPRRDIRLVEMLISLADQLKAA